MATVIDSLIIELALDPAKFTKGQVAIVSALKQMEEEAVKRGKNTEKSFLDVSDAVDHLHTRFLRLGAAIVGAYSLEQLVSHTISSTAALGRFSGVLGINTELLSKWQNVGKLVGGTAEGINESISASVKQFARLSISGPGGGFPYITAALKSVGVDISKFVDQKGELRDITGYFLALSESFYKMRNEPGRAAIFAEEIGITPDLLQVLIKGPDAVRKMLADIQSLGPATQKDAEEAQKLVEAWNRAQIAVQPISRGFSFVAANFIKELADKATGIFSGEPPKSPTWALPNTGTILPNTNYIGAGTTSTGIAALANSLRGAVPEARFTSFQDTFHSGFKSPHNEGRALDFALPAGATPFDYAETTGKIQKWLRSLGVDATVLNEFSRGSSPHWTAPHIHVQFNTPEAMQKYISMTAPAQVSNYGPHLPGSINNSRNVSSTFNTTINAPNGSPQGIADAFSAAAQRMGMISPAINAWR
jgi:hypothetical protein